MQLGAIHDHPMPHQSLIELTKLMAQADKDTITKVFNALYFHSPDLIRQNGDTNIIQFNQITYTTFHIIS